MVVFKSSDTGNTAYILNYIMFGQINKKNYT